MKAVVLLKISICFIQLKSINYSSINTKIGHDDLGSFQSFANGLKIVVVVAVDAADAHLLGHQAIDYGVDLIKVWSLIGILVPAF